VGRSRHFLFSKCTAGIPASTVGNMFSVMPVIMARMCMAGNTFSEMPMIWFLCRGKPWLQGITPTNQGWGVPYT